MAHGPASFSDRLVPQAGQLGVLAALVANAKNPTTTKQALLKLLKHLQVDIKSDRIVKALPNLLASLRSAVGGPEGAVEKWASTVTDRFGTLDPAGGAGLEDERKAEKKTAAAEKADKSRVVARNREARQAQREASRQFGGRSTTVGTRKVEVPRQGPPAPSIRPGVDAFGRTVLTGRGGSTSLGSVVKLIPVKGVTTQNLVKAEAAYYKLAGQVLGVDKANDIKLLRGKEVTKMMKAIGETMKGGGKAALPESVVAMHSSFVEYSHKRGSRATLASLAEANPAFKSLNAEARAANTTLSKRLAKASGKIKPLQWHSIMDLVRKYPIHSATVGVMLAGHGVNKFLDARTAGKQTREAKNDIISRILGSKRTAQDYINALDADEAVLTRGSAVAGNNPQLFEALAGAQRSAAPAIGGANTGDVFSTAQAPAAPGGGAGGGMDEAIRRALRDEVG